MKILKNHSKIIFGVKHKLFTLIFNTKTKKYYYYVNALGTKKIGDCLIYKSKEKSKLFNKYTMRLIGLFYTAYSYTLKWPFMIITTPFLMYLEGCKNFIQNRVWQDNVRFFHWVNIVIIIVLLFLIVLKV
jgi:hypothetical protein